MMHQVRCAKCEMTYHRTVLHTNGCPDCGSKQESSEPYDDYSNKGIILSPTTPTDETEEEQEKLAFKKYIERENYLHFGKPSILMRLIKKLRKN